MTEINIFNLVCAFSFLWYHNTCRDGTGKPVTLHATADLGVSGAVIRHAKILESVYSIDKGIVVLKGYSLRLLTG